LALIFLLGISFLPVCAQDVTVVEVCVPVMRSGVNTVSVTEARDRLVKALNRLKPDKKLNASVRAVPLEETPGQKAMAEASEKGCLFLLSTYLTDLRISSVLKPSEMNSGDLVAYPIFSTTIEYELTRAVDGTPFGTGSVKEEDTTSLTEVVRRAVNHLAAKAFADLRDGGSAPASDLQAAHNQTERLLSQRIEVLQMGTDACQWLPKDIPHAAGLRGACEYAISLSEKMPNLVCDEAASRYRGNDRVATDLVTATLRYEDGNESYSGIKVNGKAAPQAIAQRPGLWSTGEFASNNLRSIFDPRNQARFDFTQDGSWHQHPAWIFTYLIAMQNDPLWRLHEKDQVVAPPYSGEIWIDQKTGAVLRFRSAAKDLPESFPMAEAEEQLGYESVAFEDGSSLVLPVDFTVSTTYRGEEATRNVVRLANCHKFRAKAHILLDVPASSGENTSLRSAVDAATAQRELEQNNQIYSILQEQAIRDDAARLDLEQRLELVDVTAAAFSKLSALEKQRQEIVARNEAATPSDVSNNDAITTLKVKVSLVPVSVVLRDPTGRAIGNRRREDFRLFEDRRPQVISSFSVEQSGVVRDKQTPAPEQNNNVSGEPAFERDVAYVFDDIHGSSDLANATEAARRHITALQPEDRAAIVSTSGQVQLDFTRDREALLSALRNLKPFPNASASDCPPLSYYIADQMVNQHDADANDLAVADTIACAFGGMTSAFDKGLAQRLASAKALEVLSASSRESRQALTMLREVIRHTASMPGKRSIVLASPGFLTLDPDALQAVGNLIEQAIRADIVINALDIRGLYSAGMDASHGPTADPALRLRLDTAEAGIKSDVMADLAHGTGGTFFEHNNDLDEGFRRTTDTPEYVYTLGFSPQKLDGKLHKLKVTVYGSAKLTVQARQGYYALKPDAPKPEPPK
jgi:VWFA-related protein